MKSKVQTDLVIINIDLGEGKKDSIVVRPGESTDLLAKDFCEKHELGEVAVSSISAYLKEKLTEIARVEEELIRPGLTRSNSRKPIETLEKVTPEKRSRSKLKMNEGVEPGVRLYTSGINRIRQREAKLDLMKEEKELKELDGVTFRPSINSTATPTRVSSKKKLRLKDSLKTVMKECTFTPRLSERSLELAQKKKKTTDKFTELYENSSTMRLKRDLLVRTHAANGYRSPSVTTPRFDLNSSVERLHNSKKHLEASLQKIRLENSHESLYDRQSGKKLFEPTTGRSPRSRPENIFEYLHERKSPRLKPESVVRKPENNKKSQQIIEKMKYTRYKEIFYKLNPQNGKIRHDLVQTSMLDEKLQSILTPLLDEIEEEQESLSLEEFCEALEALMKVLTPEERHNIVFPQKEKHQQESQEPEVKATAKNIRETYQRLVSYQERSRKKLEEARKVKKTQEILECTFQPFIR